ncbi:MULTISPECIES: PAS domain-containing protein [Pseudanabaena]|uniref:PAS domain-containing protein n=1 Tax=Pseudanabaena TaxID=1152 RepID=UPI002478777F|nr:MULTISPECIES: PAS domain-containing protein [Pseudanabaena]MEA5488405.1 PAS domain-containing protein [Pseudanabaena sp. CCNP1317]WGS70389.1 PAS domain-containing protein [Pseudanabaena galeata CCNP1313]
MDKFRSRMLICSEILQSMRHYDNQCDNVEKIFQTITTKLLNLVQAVHVSIYKLDKFADRHSGIGISGKIIAEAIAPQCQPCSQFQLENILREEYQWGQDITGQILDLYTAGMTRCELNLAEVFVGKAYLLVPIILSDREPEHPLWGFLTVHQCTARDGEAFQSSWDQDDVLMLQQIAIQIEIILQRENRSTRLLEQVKDAEQSYATLYRWMENYRCLVEQIPNVCYVSPIKNTPEFAYVSPQLQTLLGIDSSKWNAGFFNSWAEYVHPDDRDRVHQAVRHTIETGEPFCCEYRMIASDGKIIWLRDTAHLGLATDGKTKVLRGSAFDISDRKEIEQALRKSEASLAEAQQVASLGSWEWNISDDEIIWSRELFNIYKYDPAIPIPNFEEHLQFYTISSQEKLRQAVDEIINTGKSYHLELDLQRPEVSGQYIEAIGHAEYNDQGQVVRLYGTAQDISDRKLVEAKLLQNETLLKLTISNVPLGIATFDLEGKFLMVNQGFCHTFGYSEAELLNMTAIELTHPNSVEKTLKALNRLIENEATSGELEKQYIHKNGHAISVISRFGIVRDENGKPIQFVAGVEDVTERKQTEAKLAAAQVAELSNKAKSEFLAVMSHELRTPMNTVIGMTEILGNTLLTRQQQQYVATIRQGGEVLLSVINNILDFSRIESGYLEIEESPFKLQQCIEEVLELMSSRTAEKFLELVTFVSLDVPQLLLGDYTRLRQILVNLVSNAIKFTESGEVVITVTSRLIDYQTNTYELRFDVRDTGIGLAPKAIAKLFRAYSQADKSIARQYGGTGLGLVICKQLCELMGGEIGVSSNVGEGSTFSFSIKSRAIAEDTDTTNLLLPELIGKRVLSVNTNSTLQQAIALYTKPWGMRVQAAYSATEALQSLTTSSFDVVLIDRKLKESDGSQIDGLELAKNIQEIFPELNLILLTPVNINLNENNNIKLACFRDYITKPISVSKLFQAFSNVFSRKATTFPQCITNVGSQSLYTSDEILKDENFANCYPFKILVVEDNPVNHKILLLMLESLGYRADSVDNGQKAINAVSNQAYDLIFMDIQMPIMDGLTSSQSIRQLAIQQPWIIGLSANAFSESRDSALGAGMNDYLTKPLKTTNLIAALQKIPQHQNLVIDHSQPPIDLSILSNLEDSVGSQNLDELITVYLEHSAKEIATMKAAFQTKDFVKMEAHNHALKGGSATFGATQLLISCQALQSICKMLIKSNAYTEEDISKIAILLENIEDQYNYVYQTFQTRGFNPLML